MEGQPAPRRRSFIIGPAIGFFAAALMLTASIIIFRPEKPILWPPDPSKVITLAYCAFGTVFTAALAGTVWLASYVILVFGKRRTWRDLGNGILQALITLALLAAAFEISLQAFYWPWASASVVHTVRSNPEKRRLSPCARFLETRRKANLGEKLLEGADTLPAATRAAVNYVLAASGDRDALRRLVALAEELPRLSEEAVSEETPISGREDVFWLLSDLLDLKSSEPQDLGSNPLTDIDGLRWDSETRKYVSALPTG